MTILEVISSDDVYLGLSAMLDEEISKIEKYPPQVTTFKTASISLIFFKNGELIKKDVFTDGLAHSNKSFLSMLKALIYQTSDWVKITAVCALIFLCVRRIYEVVLFLTLAGLCSALFFKFLSAQNRDKQLFKDSFYSDSKQKEPEVCSIKDAIRLAIFRASEEIASAYIGKKSDYDSVFAKAQIQVIRNHKLYQYETQEIKL